LKMNRLYVHLSADIETAKKVSTRRAGNAVIFKVAALEMYNDGYKFFQSANGVWLVETVPSKYLSKIPTA